VASVFTSARSESAATVITLIQCAATPVNRLIEHVSIIVNVRLLSMISINKRMAVFAFCAIGFCHTVFAESLYERLGGEKGVAQFVDQTIDLTASDPLTKRSFDKVDLKKLKLKIAVHTCALTHGPCKYTGDSMKVVHQGMDITESEFYAMVEILRGTLIRAQVGEGAKNELLRILVPMKREIVSR